MSLAFPKPVKRLKEPKGLSRGKPMEKKAPRRIERETAAEKHWKGPWIHSRPCVGRCFGNGHVCSFAPGRGIEQMHFRNNTGLGLKASNFKSLPACNGLHTDYDQTNGLFACMGDTGKKSWFEARLIEERADFAAEHGCAPEDWTP